MTTEKPFQSDILSWGAGEYPGAYPRFGDPPRPWFRPTRWIGGSWLRLGIAVLITCALFLWGLSMGRASEVPPSAALPPTGLRSGDLIAVEVRSPEGTLVLTEDTVVDPQGYIMLSDGRRTKGAGRTPAQLVQELHQTVATRAVPDPVISVQVTHPINIYLQGSRGSVASGPLQMRGGSHLSDILDAVALGRLADLRCISILRDGARKAYDLVAAAGMEQPELDPVLRDGDWVTVPNRMADEELPRVYAFGTVSQPGRYSLPPGGRLDSLLHKLRVPTNGDSPDLVCHVIRGRGPHPRIFRVPLGADADEESERALRLLLQPDDMLVVAPASAGFLAGMPRVARMVLAMSHADPLVLGRRPRHTAAL